jgi:preprotein translocase subunit SecY
MADELKRTTDLSPVLNQVSQQQIISEPLWTGSHLPGAILLAFCRYPARFFQLSISMSAELATFFGGTSLLIMVGVILDTLQQIETQLLMRQYDGLMSFRQIAGKAGSCIRYVIMISRLGCYQSKIFNPNEHIVGVYFNINIC